MHRWSMSRLYDKLIVALKEPSSTTHVVGVPEPPQRVVGFGGACPAD